MPLDVPDSPPAARLPGGRRRLRTAVGLALVLGSAGAGAQLVAAADESVAVWVAARDLAPGAVLADGDLEREQVRLLGAAPRYLSADGASPVGQVLDRRVRGGELVPASALQSDSGERRLVAVPIERGHLPEGLAPGDQVDVYVTDVEGGGAPRLVLGAALVAERPAGDGMGDADGVVLQVPPPRVPVLLAALGQGRLDLVRLP